MTAKAITLLVLAGLSTSVPVTYAAGRGAASADGFRAIQVRREFEDTRRGHVAATYRAHLAGQDPPPSFLSEARLEWPSWRENQLGLPRGVFDAYAFYVRSINDRDLGSARVYRARCAGRTVFAVGVSTDGDSGWLELYDEHGLLLGAGRTYLELIAWDRLDVVRGQTESLELPPALRDAQARTLWGKPPAD